MQPPRGAYFSMEAGLESWMPTYSGGLGVLASDTIRSAANLEMPMVAVPLIHRRGCFFQRLDARGQQSEEPVAWPVNDFAELTDGQATVDIEGTPLPPMKASGMSGMKAAMNGVPSLSVFDGWWIESHLEGVIGWSIGDRAEACIEPHPEMEVCHAAELYRKLEETVLPCFYRDREHFLEIMRHAIALSGAFFSSQRMVAQYSTMPIDWGKRVCPSTHD
jgi:glucan phosphorylase